MELRARWVFPLSGPPIANGVVEIQDRRIAAVHDRAAPDAQDLGNVALTPALVNAHTHLEFSDLTDPLPRGSGFADWIRQVLAYRSARDAAGSETVAANIREGLRQSRSAGVGCLGEIATSSASCAAFRERGSAGVVFRELICLSEERVEEQLLIAEEHLNADSGGADISLLCGGLSPHAPYSVHPHLLNGVVDLARRQNAPIAMHIAETLAELELLAYGSGELSELLKELGLWQPELFGDRRPLDVIKVLTEAPRVAMIHGNYLDHEEVDVLAACPHMSVVYCPRTHAYFGHDEHPWRTLQAAGVNVALGTDSRASNPDLDLWGEVRFLRDRFPQVAPSELLEMATLNGAIALGLEEKIGTLQPDKRADLTVFDLPERPGEAHELLLRATPRALTV